MRVRSLLAIALTAPLAAAQVTPSQGGHLGTGSGPKLGTGSSGPTELVVTTMPGFPNAPRLLPSQRHPVRPDRDVVVWGSVNHGDGSANGALYTWSFFHGPEVNVVNDGDLSGVVSNSRFVPEVVRFELQGGATSARVKALLQCSLAGVFASREVEIAVVSVADPLSDGPLERIEFDRQIAVENGLRYLYLSGPSGVWATHGTNYAATGFGIWAFEIHGHVPLNDPDEDVYGPLVHSGLRYLTESSVSEVSAMSHVRADLARGATVAGKADQNDNGKAILIPASGAVGYETPMVGSAIVASLSPDRLVEAGTLKDKTFRVVVEDLADRVAGGMTVGSQVNATFWNNRGGWRYGLGQHEASDMSVNSWAYVFLEGAEGVFDVDVPDWVKQESEWTLVSHQTNGSGNRHFGYNGTPWAFSPGLATTGGGLSGLVFAGSAGPFVAPGEVIGLQAEPLNTIQEKREAALGWVGEQWGSPGGATYGSGNRGNPYVMWTVARALRLSATDMGFEPGEVVPLSNGGVSFDWETGYQYDSGVVANAGSAREGYFPYLIRTQYFGGTDPAQWGRWNGPSSMYTTPFTTAAYLLVLGRDVFLASGCGEPVAGPVELIPAPSSIYPTGETLVLSGLAIPSTLDREIVAVLVDGQVPQVVDAQWNFFQPITVQQGLNSHVITIIDSCGVDDFPLEFFGEEGGEVVFENLSEATPLIDADYTNTTWVPETQTLRFDVTPCNVDLDVLRPPLVFVLDELVPQGAVVVNADGEDDDGLPFLRFEVGAEGLAPGDCAPSRTVEVQLQALAQVDFTGKWFAEGQLPPQITTIPIVSALPGATYVYDADAVDPNQTPLTWSLPTAPLGMTIDPDTGVVTWDPTPPGTSSSLVRIRVEDTDGDFAEQSYSLAVSDDLNRAPFFISLPVTTAEEGQLYEYPAEALDLDHDALEYSLLEAPAGMTVDAATGLVSWTPGALAAGIHPVSLFVDDSRGGTATQAFAVEVAEGLNAPPEITSAPVEEAFEGSVYAYDVEATDPDQDDLLFSLLSAPAGMSIDPDSGLIQWLPGVPEVGFHDISVQVDDQAGGTDQQDFVLEVIFVNDEPEFTSDPVLAVEALTLYEYDADAIDADDDELLFSLSLAPAGMTVDPVSGLVMWSPALADIGTHPVQLAVEDGNGGMDFQDYDLEVLAPNNPPEITSLPSLQIVGGMTYLYDVEATDVDQDDLEYSLDEGPVGMTIDPISGLVSWATTLADAGLHGVTVRVEDGLGGDDTQPFDLEVLFVNGDPQITSTAVLMTSVGATYSYDVEATDPDGHDLEFTLDQAPTGMTIDPFSGLITWTPTAQDVMQHPVTVAVSDPWGGRDEQAYTLTVKPNGPPTFVSSPVAVAVIGLEYSYDADAVDPEAEELTYSLVQGPAGFGVAPDTGLVTWPAASVASGQHPIEIRVEDPGGGFDLQDWLLDVQEDTSPPVALVTPNPEFVQVGSAVELTVQAVDDVGVESLTLEVDGQSVPLDAFGVGVYTPQTAGPYLASATATDAALNSFTDTAPFFAVDPTVTGFPTARIDVPGTDQVVSSLLDVIGTASGSEFAEYLLEIAEVGSNEFVLLARSEQPVVDGVLDTLDASGLCNGFYSLRLTSRNLGGNTASDAVVIRVDSGRNDMGHFGLSYLDKALQLGSVPLTAARFYDSRDKTVGDFGVGWNLDIGGIELHQTRKAGESWTQNVVGQFIPTYFLVPAASHTVEIRLGSGEPMRFSPTPIPESQQLFPIQFLDGIAYTPQGQAAGTLIPHEHPFVVNPGSVGPVEFLDGAFDLYDPDGFTYISPEGFEFVFQRPTPQSLRHVLVAHRSPEGVQTDIDDDGITRSDGASIDFTRDAQGRITRIACPNGTAVEYEYDLQGNLALFRDELGNTSRYFYDENHNLLDIRDPLGNQPTRMEYNDDGQLIAMVDQEGNRFEVTLDISGNEEFLLDANGNLIHFVYDNLGRLLLQEQPFTLEGVTSLVSQLFTYTPDGDVETSVDYDGVSKEFEYDTNGRVTKTIVDPTGLALESTSSYDADGRVLEMVDAGGNRVTYTYDGNGDLTVVTDAENHSTLIDYNSNGDVERQTDPLGHYSILTYGPNGRVIRQEEYDSSDTLLRKEERTHTPSGEELTRSVFRTIDGQLTELTTTFSYDEKGRLLTTTDPLGGTQTNVYDALDHLVQEIDASGRSTHFEFDGRGLVTKKTYPNDSFETFEYDGNANLIRRVDRLGRETNYEYDEANQATSSTGDAGPTLERIVSPAGRILATIDAHGARTDLEYDAAGRSWKALLPEVFDAISGAPARPVEIKEFDLSGNVTAKIDPLGHRREFEFDKNRRMTLFREADGGETHKEYDALGRIVRERAPDGTETDFEYDALGRLVAVVLPPPELGGARPRYEYGYDEGDLLLSVADPLGRTTTFEYDELGRRVARSLPSGRRETFEYDAVSNLTRHVDFNGDSAQFEYDVMDRLTRVDYGDGSSVQLQYDEGDRLITATDEHGLTQYEYDNGDHLTRRIDPNGHEVSYAYSATGQLVSVTAAGRTLSYLSDDLGRLEAVIAPEGVYSYEYDLAGGVRTLHLPSGAEMRYDYDSAGRPMSVRVFDASDVEVASFSLERDISGNATRMTELDGSIEEYTLDGLDRLVSTVRTGLDPYMRTYEYDRAGNRERFVSDGVETLYVHDEDSRISSAGGISYTYDDNGNRLSRTAGGSLTTYAFDAQNRLRSVSQVGSSVTYEYDHGGNMLSREEAGTTSYLVSDLRSLTGYVQVLAEMNSGGNPTIEYTFGSHLLGAQVGGSAVGYVRDSAQNVRASLDAIGDLAGERSYDPYGEVLTESGVLSGAYGFAGERQDPATGLVYLRARHYDPETGTFLSRDPFEGLLEIPLSFMAYAYAHNNPIHNQDPSGQTTLMSTMGSLAIQSILVAIDVGSLWCSMQSIKKSIGKVVLAVSLGSFAISLAQAFSDFSFADTSPPFKVSWEKPVIPGVEENGVTSIGIQYDFNPAKHDHEIELGIGDRSGRSASVKATYNSVKNDLDLDFGVGFKKTIAQFDYCGLDFGSLDLVSKLTKCTGSVGLSPGFKLPFFGAFGGGTEVGPGVPALIEGDHCKKTMKVLGFRIL